VFFNLFFLFCAFLAIFSFYYVFHFLFFQFLSNLFFPFFSFYVLKKNVYVFFFVNKNIEKPYLLLFVCIYELDYVKPPRMSLRST
jgi:hypothetical protein